MTKEELNEYLNLLEKFNNRSLTGTLEEKSQIEKFNSLYHKSEECKLLIDRLKILKNKEEQNRVINEYLSSKEETVEEYILFDKIYDYPEKLGKLTKIQIDCLRYLIFEKRKYNLQYINLDSLQAIDSQENIYSAKYHEDLNKIIIYINQIAIDNKKSVDIKENIMSVFENNKDTIVENSYIESVDKNIDKKTKIHTKFNNAYGFANAALLSLFAGFFGGMFTTIVIEIIKIKSIY